METAQLRAEVEGRGGLSIIDSGRGEENLTVVQKA